MKLPISASGFGRICGAFAIRNDFADVLYRDAWDFDGATVAFVVGDKPYAAGCQARRTSLDVGQRCEATEDGR
jgi:hypothetical protein